MSTDTDAGPEAQRTDAPHADGVAQFGAVLDAGVGIVAALRKLLAAVASLLVAEARVLRASVSVVVLCVVALVAFAVSLWACVVALIGWSLAVATGSAGIALGILVLLHGILVVVTWLAIKRAIHHASFPGTRAELRALGHELRRDVARFQDARPESAASAGPEGNP